MKHQCYLDDSPYLYNQQSEQNPGALFFCLPLLVLMSSFLSSPLMSGQDLNDYL